MIEGLTMKHIKTFEDLLIMANQYQLHSMGMEILRELQKRREAQLPKFQVAEQ